MRDGEKLGMLISAVITINLFLTFSCLEALDEVLIGVVFHSHLRPLAC